MHWRKTSKTSCSICSNSLPFILSWTIRLGSLDGLTDFQNGRTLFQTPLTFHINYGVFYKQSSLLTVLIARFLNFLGFSVSCLMLTSRHNTFGSGQCFSTGLISRVKSYLYELPNDIRLLGAL